MKLIQIMIGQDGVHIIVTRGDLEWSPILVRP
jgi:hypothetical protein